MRAATLLLVIFAALFASMPGSADADTAPPAVAEKTPIRLDAETPPKGIPAAKTLLIDAAAKLLLVLAAVFALFWLLRRFLSTGRGMPTPGGAFEVISLVPLSAKCRLALVRFGNRLLLLSVAAERVETIAETDEPNDVARILEAVGGKETQR